VRNLAGERRQIIDWGLDREWDRAAYGPVPPNVPRREGDTCRRLARRQHEAGEDRLLARLAAEPGEIQMLAYVLGFQRRDVARQCFRVTGWRRARPGDRSADPVQQFRLRQMRESRR